MANIFNNDSSNVGTHALVIGVSRYRHLADGSDPTPTGVRFDVEQLSSAAKSASEFANWLMSEYKNPDAPLRSLRVLLSPGDGEVINPELAARLPQEFAATKDAVQQDLIAFRQICQASRENVAVVYVAGHGVQFTSEGAVLLLEDFAAPGQLNVLSAALDIRSVHSGLNNKNAARNQFWFVDVCRQRPEIAKDFEDLRDAMGLDSEFDGATGSSPIYLSATTGTSAYGQPGGTSLFYQSLDWCLRDGGASVGPDPTNDKWHVSVNRLAEWLPKKTMSIARASGVEQFADVAGRVTPSTFHHYDEPPIVDVSVQLSPEQARACSTATLKDESLNDVMSGQTNWPFQTEIPSGNYVFKVETLPPYEDKAMIIECTPTNPSHVIEL